MAFLVVLAFAVIGVSLFGNGFGQCLDAEDALQDYRVIDDKRACLNATAEWNGTGVLLDGLQGAAMPLRWEVPPQNFDTTPNAVLTLFQILFLDGWSGFMHAGTDTRGVYLQPSVEHNTYALVYFISFTFIGPLFFMNLIIGAVVSTFEELHRKGAGMDMLTEEQRRWVYTQQVLP